MRVSVIVNPRAGAGRAARDAASLRAELSRRAIPHVLYESERPRHAIELARRALAEGCDVLAVLGGDGTLNEVSQAYIDDSGAPLAGPPLALIPAGTGGDFARSCSFTTRDVPAAVDRMVAGKRRGLDLGVLTLRDERGAPVRRAFVNVASVGISGAVDERVERGPKWLGGKTAFMLATLSAAASYRNLPVEIEVDGRTWHSGPVLITAIANGQYLGGGMHIAPRAAFDDGQLDVVCVGDLSRAKFLALFPSVYRGAHLELEPVRSTRASRVAVRALDPNERALVDVDGETPGFLPLEARIFPRALELASD